MTKSNAWIEADMKRAIKVATEAGIQVSGIEIRRDSALLIFSVDENQDQDEGPKPKSW